MPRARENLVCLLCEELRVYARKAVLPMTHRNSTVPRTRGAMGLEIDDVGVVDHERGVVFGEDDASAPRARDRFTKHFLEITARTEHGWRIFRKESRSDSCEDSVASSSLRVMHAMHHEPIARNDHLFCPRGAAAQSSHRGLAGRCGPHTKERGLSFAGHQDHSTGEWFGEKSHKTPPEGVE